MKNVLIEKKRSKNSIQNEIWSMRLLPLFSTFKHILLQCPCFYLNLPLCAIHVPQCAVRRFRSALKSPDLDVFNGDSKIEILPSSWQYGNFKPQEISSHSVCLELQVIAYRYRYKWESVTFKIRVPSSITKVIFFGQKKS